MKLFQYWDQPTPPDEVRQWIATIRAHATGFEHRLFDGAGAADWIARHRSAPELACFTACAVPAMQADYLRLCLLDSCGGLYLDADFTAVAALDDLAAQVPDALLLDYGGLVVNGLLLFKTARHPFVAAALALATDAIAQRRFESVLMTAGPAVLTALVHALDPDARGPIDHMVGLSRWAELGWASLLAAAHARCSGDEALATAYRLILRRPTAWHESWLEVTTPRYQAGVAHWRNWRGSIYR